MELDKIMKDPEVNVKKLQSSDIKPLKSPIVKKARELSLNRSAIKANLGEESIKGVSPLQPLAI